MLDQSEFSIGSIDSISIIANLINLDYLFNDENISSYVGAQHRTEAVAQFATYIESNGLTLEGILILDFSKKLKFKEHY
jgi:hypothetical protein